MPLAEIFFCIAMLLPLIPMAMYRQWRLFFVFFAFYLCFGLMEWVSVAQTGHSISQHFWIFDSAHPVGGWIIVGCMAVMWVALIWHFKTHKKQ